MRVLKSLMVALAMAVMMNAASAGEMGVMFEGPWIREAPPTAKALAGYMTIRNHSSMRQTLVGAESVDFESVMLHQTVMKDGTAMMVHRHKIELPQGIELKFEPGGYHLMLMRPKRALKMGDKVDIDLLFSDGARKTVTFTVRKGNGMASGHSQSQHNH